MQFNKVRRVGHKLCHCSWAIAHVVKTALVQGLKNSWNFSAAAKRCLVPKQGELPIGDCIASHTGSCNSDRGG